MKKLLQEYEKIGSIKSKLANFIWKCGIIICSILYCINVFCSKQSNYSILYYLIIIIILFVISMNIFIRKAAKKLNIDCRLRNTFSLNYIRKIYIEMEKYQQKWITNYCNKNKINNFNKLNVLREEIKNEKEKSTIKYINPIIIGTLSLTVWEIALQKVVNKIGFWNMLPLAFVIALGTSVFIGWITKILLEDKDVFIEFEKFSNKKRLEELILCRMLKSKK